MAMVKFRESNGDKVFRNKNDKVFSAFEYRPDPQEAEPVFGVISAEFSSKETTGQILRISAASFNKIISTLRAADFNVFPHIKQGYLFFSPGSPTGMKKAIKALHDAGLAPPGMNDFIQEQAEIRQPEGFYTVPPKKPEKPGRNDAPSPGR